MPLVPQENYRNQLEPMLQQFVTPAFGSKHGHLRAKACWVTGRFADIDFKDGTGFGPTFIAFFTLTVKALQDAELPVSSSYFIASLELCDAQSASDLGPHQVGGISQCNRIEKTILGMD